MGAFVPRPWASSHAPVGAAAAGASSPLGGHVGRDRTLALARRSVWWPGPPATVGEACPARRRLVTRQGRPSPAGPARAPLPSARADAAEDASARASTSSGDS